MPEEFIIQSSTAAIAGQDAGEGPAVVLLHGLTATRRYVVMGSRSLERSGHRVVAYDARGHGESGRGTETYDYARLTADLLAVMDGRGVDRAVLAGASMGAHTLVRFALAHPGRVSGLVIITPAYDGSAPTLGRFGRLADGLHAGGIDGFVAATDFASIDASLRDTVQTVIRQRMARHQDLAAIEQALREVPLSRPFDGLDALSAIAVPTTVIGSSDGPDPDHPLAVAEAYADAITGAQLVRDAPGASPVAWQGSQVSRVIAEVVARASAAG